MVAVTSRSSISQLLSDLSSTSASLQRGDWLAGGSGSGAGLGLLGSPADPLSVLTDAGFGYLTAMISFLDEPLKQLTGNPGSVSASSRTCQETGQSMSSLADDYRTAAGTQTSGWSSDAADGYRQTGGDLADGMAALGHAATGVGTAISGAGQAVAQTIQDVTEQIHEAVAQILPIMVQARASGGAAIAEAIPRCVQIAERYAQQIALRMRGLLSSGQNLMHSVQAVVQGVEAVKQALTHTGEQAAAPGGNQPNQQANPAAPAAGSPPAGAAPTGTAPASADPGLASADPFGQGFADTMSPSDFAPSTVDSGESSPLYQVPADSGLPATVTPQSFAGLTSPSGTALSGIDPVGSGYTVPGIGGSAVTGGLGPVSGVGDNAYPGGGAKAGSSNARNAAEEDGATGGGAKAAGGQAGAAGSKSPGGMMAPGGLRGGTNQEDKEHRSPSWLLGEQGIFDSDEQVAPAVIEQRPDGDDEFPPLPRRRIPAPEPAAARVEPQSAEPKTVDLKAVEPTVESQPVEPAEPKAAEPKPPQMVWRLGEDGSLVSVPKEEPKPEG